MKNIIRPSVSNNSDGSVTIRPQPNRAKNLSSIADAIEYIADAIEYIAVANGTEPVTLDAQTARKLCTASSHKKWKATKMMFT